MRWIFQVMGVVFTHILFQLPQVVRLRRIIVRRKDVHAHRTASQGFERCADVARSVVTQVDNLGFGGLVTPVQVCTHLRQHSSAARRREDEIPCPP